MVLMVFSAFKNLSYLNAGKLFDSANARRTSAPMLWRVRAYSGSGFRSASKVIIKNLESSSGFRKQMRKPFRILFSKNRGSQDENLGPHPGSPGFLKNILRFAALFL